MIASGKTKDVFLQQNGRLRLYFKDSVTGRGGKIDPGANEVLGEVKGKGNASLQLSTYFFKLLQTAGLPTHFLKAFPEKNSMLVKQARSFNLEVICREKAYGSFIRRYGSYVQAGVPLPSLVEFTLKDDARGDPLITEDALTALKILTPEAVRQLKETTRRATALIKEDLAGKGLDLLDIKLEFGEVEGKIVIIDEISGDTMRVEQAGKILTSQELCNQVLK
ncbi:MAG: phosphoribosylaminoimidazolesuccinocarboxamide synthase [Firmicutes bacterium]|nr:phosphoribosylaminoimidazolesuccinocarboxamide synthase [Bacillota bacterium]